MRDARTSGRGVRHRLAWLVLAALICSPVVAYGQTVTAAWDASPPAEQVTSYQVCVGTSSLSCNVQLASVGATETSHAFSPTGGVFHYVAVRAINASGMGTYSSETRFSIPSFTQPLNQSSPVGVAITALNLSVSDPDGNTLAFTHTGLPTGLLLNASTGQITGTPSSAGTYNVTVFATDAFVSVSRSFTWTVTSPTADTQPPVLAITSHTNGQTLSSSSATLAGTATDSNRGGNGVASVTVNGQAATGGTATGSATANWSRAITLSPGSNTITVQATDSRGNVASQQITLNYAIAPVTGVTLGASAASPQNTGTAITVTANGSGGVDPRQYKFFVQLGGGVAQMVRDWSTTATYSWTPSVAGSYVVSVWARSAGVTADAAQASAQMAYVINTPAPVPVTSVSMVSNLLTPQNTGTAITFTAAGAGGVAPREYKFLVRQGSESNLIAQNWSTSASFTWTPVTAASYTITVWARSAGVTTDLAQASAQATFVINTPPVPPVTSATLTSSLASPQEAGTTVTFSAGAAGGVAPAQYKFLVQQVGGTAQMVRDWSTTATYAWTPATAGSYVVSVWARSAGVTADAAQASAQTAYTISTPPPAPVATATLTPNLTSPQNAGTAVTFTAAASGGVGPRQFKFFVQTVGGSTQMVRDWSTATTYTWAPSTPASYNVIVWARSAGVTTDAAQASATSPYVINAPPPSLTITGLTPNVPSPQPAGTAITFTASATGGTGGYSFKWWLFDGVNWAMLRDWSTATTFTWTPAVANANYRVGIWARDSSTTAEVNNVNLSVPFVVTAPPPAPVTITRLTSNLASPQPTGTAITFTAAAAGGMGGYSFKWWLFDGVNWRVVRDWSTGRRFTWTPGVANANYRIGVSAREATTTAEAYNPSLSVPFVITGSAPTPPPSAGPLAITGLTSNYPSPQAAGTAITFTAGATGGTGPYSFKWWLFDGINWTLARDWSTAATFTWTPGVANANYRVGIWARDATTTADVSNVNLSVPFVITAPAPAPAPTPSSAEALSVTSITSSLVSPQVAGTTVTFTAAATGGVAPYQYKWWLFDGVSWTMVADWSSSATFTWTPTAASAAYRIGVWVRDSTTTADVSNVNLSVPFVISVSGELVALTIGLSTPEPTAGSPILFTGLATGGYAPYSFKWWIHDGESWTMVRDWGPGTYTWTPPRAGTYRVGFWVRSANSTDNTGSVNVSVPVVVR